MKLITEIIDFARWQGLLTEKQLERLEELGYWRHDVDDYDRQDDDECYWAFKNRVKKVIYADDAYEWDERRHKMDADDRRDRVRSPKPGGGSGKKRPALNGEKLEELVGADLDAFDAKNPKFVDFRELWEEFGDDVWGRLRQMRLTLDDFYTIVQPIIIF